MVHDKGYVLGFMAGELLLTSSLEECVFIRPRELAAMQAAGMASVRDLLFMLPRRYEDRRMFDRYDSLSAICPCRSSLFRSEEHTSELQSRE